MPLRNQCRRANSHELRAVWQPKDRRPPILGLLTPWTAQHGFPSGYPPWSPLVQIAQRFLLLPFQRRGLCLAHARFYPPCLHFAVCRLYPSRFRAMVVDLRIPSLPVSTQMCVVLLALDYSHNSCEYLSWYNVAKDVLVVRSSNMRRMRVFASAPRWRRLGMVSRIPAGRSDLRPTLLGPAASLYALVSRIVGFPNDA